MPLFPLLLLKFFGLGCKAHTRNCVLVMSPCPMLSEGKWLLWGWPSWQSGMGTTGSDQGLHSSGRLCCQKKTTTSGFIFPTKSASSIPSGASHPIAGPHSNCGLSELLQDRASPGIRQLSCFPVLLYFNPNSKTLSHPSLHSG